ncbi:hypothetical protein A6A05_19620 [Magnetospirillum moscoviense]|uniref:Uncharacterized protein n=1 Tax=Magnetospirillum moscoviense TaxID=1437059 RepID=A0A178MXX1_9PROT|nr:hypothetical protein A6A05_19620 [Magnetospirillum moscoviense]
MLGGEVVMKRFHHCFDMRRQCARLFQQRALVRTECDELKRDRQTALKTILGAEESLDGVIEIYGSIRESY